MIIEFKPLLLPVLTKWVADKIIKSKKGDVEVSLDLGLTKSVVKVLQDSVCFPSGELIPIKDLQNLEENDVYFLRDGEIFKAAFFYGGRYYRLLAISPHDAPTIEISGIRMHKNEGIKPWKDARRKVVAAKVFPGSSVLDIGTGLGYTSIWSINFGASSVVTIEKDENVIKMAEVNPWSRKLSDVRIQILLEDARESLEKFEDCSFDRVIHDPPRFSLAGELYSRDFYREIYRILKPGGWLYHYVGEPGRRRRKDIPAGVIKRLRECGFDSMRKVASGISARKPRAA